VFLTSLRLCAAMAAVAFGLSSAASAATLDISSFSRGQIGAAQAALAAFQSGAAASRTETFEGHEAWNGSSGSSAVTTNVGGFSTLGGAGHGGSAVNGGTKLHVRSDDPWVWGRHNTSGVDGNWLDSNDTHGMRWDVGGMGEFNAVAFLLTDVADVGAKFTIKAGDTLFSHTIGAAGKLANGSIHLVTILLPKAVSHLAIELRNDRLNDGFGIDGATVARVAPVPVPPAALLLISGAAGLVALRRRRRAA
jgi:hypothetical protein